MVKFKHHEAVYRSLWLQQYHSKDSSRWVMDVYVSLWAACSG